MSYWSFSRGCGWRRWLVEAHLYAGLAAGALLTVTGLYGALLVYAPELEMGASPARERVADAPAAEETAARLLKERPGTRLQDIRFDRYGNTSVIHLQEAGGEAGRGRDLHILVDPATGRTLREADRRAGARRWLRDLHHDLLAGKTGRKVNGVAAALLLLLSVTGLAVWWPGPARWRKRLGIQRGTSWKRTVWDLHNSAGFRVSAGLAFFAMTGMIFAWPEAAMELAGVQEGKKPEWRLAHSSGRQRASVAELAAAAESAAPGGRIAQIKFPKKGGEPVEARVKTPFDGHMHGHSRVWLDPEDATVLRIEDSRNLPAAQRALATAGQIHKGHFTDAGWPGALLRALWIPVGLAPGLLFLTGFLMWWNRVAVKRLRRLERPAADKRQQAAAAVALLFCASVAHGQAQPVLEGRVLDGSGAAVAQAKVTLQGSPARVAESGENGEFRFDRAAPGLLTLVIEAEGFAPLVAQARAGEKAEFRLEPAPVVTMVEVNAGTFDQIRLDEAVVLTGLTRADIATLNNRRLSDVVARMPGVFMSGPPGGDKDVRLRGLDKEFSRAQVDGVMIPDGGEKRELQLNRLPSSAVESVRIIRNPTAEFESDGLAGRVDVETRPIPQKLHVDGRLGYGARRNTLGNAVTQGQVPAGGRFGRRYGFSGTFDWLDDVLPIGRSVLYQNRNVESDNERQPQRSPNFFGNFGVYIERFGDLHLKPVLLLFDSTKDRLREVHTGAGVLTTRESEYEAKVQQTLGMTLNDRWARASGLMVDTQAGWFGSGEDKDRWRQAYKVSGGAASPDKRTLQPEFKTDKTWLISSAVSLPVRRWCGRS